MKNYSRLDLNFYAKRSRKNWSSTFQLDIQNVLNNANEWATSYDNFQKKTVLKTQLGLIPNLSYKVEF